MTHRAPELHPISFVDMDIYRGLASIIRAELLAKGYSIPTDASDDDVVDGYLNVLNRQISLRPRTFKQSAEIQVPSELASGYEELKRKVQTGESLKPHQSTSINRPDYYDALYLDWKIQHFHLGRRPHPRHAGFLERTGPLLFARVTETDFFAIQVYEHGAWSEQEQITILDANWPHELDRFRLKGLRPRGLSFTNEDVAGFRKAGITMMTEAGGTLIAPMGGGFRSNGQSSLILENRGNLVTACRDFEQKLAPILVEFAAHGGPPLDRQQIIVERRNDSLVAIEKTSRTEIASIAWPITVALL